MTAGWVNRHRNLISDIGLTAVGAAFAFQALTGNSPGLLVAAVVCLGVAGLDPVRNLRRVWVGSRHAPVGGGRNGPAGDSHDRHSLASRSARPAPAAFRSPERKLADGGAVRIQIPCLLCGGDGYIHHRRLEIAGGGASISSPCPNGCYLTKVPR